LIDKSSLNFNQILFMILALIFFILTAGILSISFVNWSTINFVRPFSLATSGCTLVLCSWLLTQVDSAYGIYQQTIYIALDLVLINISLNLGVDGFSLLFFGLSNLLVFCCLLFIWNEPLYKYYAITLLTIQLFLLIIFSALDLFVFYMFFEAVLIPMFLIIGLWGSRQRKIRAVYLFFFYTLCGSILFLVGIFYIYSTVGTCSVEYLSYITFSLLEQKFLWVAFFISFASKVPMFPFHIWLPEAHVEAPTVGSVLLAGILLKLGIYGFLRFSLPLFPSACVYFSPLIFVLSLIGILFASFCAVRQTDFKRIIAYSSIAHMNLIVIGIYSFNVLGLEGSILQSISHGFVSGGLFFLVGMLYDRYHSRFVYYYGGIVHFMPVFSSIFLFFTLSNIALPGTSSFAGELLLLLGVFKSNSIAGIFSCLGVVFCGAYSLWLCNKMLFGNLKNIFTVKFFDFNVREFLLIFPLLILIFIVGFNPKTILSFIHLLCLNIVVENLMI